MLNFYLLPSTSLILLGLQPGWTLKRPARLQALTLVAMAVRHPINNDKKRRA
jgi:hypothetical protein